MVADAGLKIRLLASETLRQEQSARRIVARSPDWSDACDQAASYQ
jgi:hypothetical protein